MDYNDLPAWIADVDVCLGHFGDNEIAAWAIPNKTFQILATGTPLITRDGPGIRELIPETGLDIAPGVYLVPPKDAAAIIAAIERFMYEWPKLSGRRLHDEIIRRFEPSAFGQRYRTLIHSLLTGIPGSGQHQMDPS